MTTVPEIFDLRSEFAQGPDRTPSKIGWALHHSATAEYNSDESLFTPDQERAIIDRIEDFHRNVRGWSIGHGYHVDVFASGNIYIIGDPNSQRAHVGNRNHEFDGLCFIGTFTPEHGPTQVAWEVAMAYIKADGKPISGGHRDLSPPGYTTCPGFEWSDYDIPMLKPGTYHVPAGTTIVVPPGD